jgi:S-adenosylmethionine/arginine decarboxylase-like enzyme
VTEVRVAAAGTSGPPGQPAPFIHVLADLVGVAATHLRDQTLLSGLLIAAASAAGLNGLGAPVVRHLPNDALSAVLLLDGSHIALHSLPDRELLLLDACALAPHDPARAVDVFARRLLPREVRTASRTRG